MNHKQLESYQNSTLFNSTLFLRVDAKPGAICCQGNFAQKSSDSQTHGGRHAPHGEAVPCVDGSRVNAYTISCKPMGALK
jgi:hypothetical protein